jgi:hypothetical protein
MLLSWKYAWTLTKVMPKDNNLLAAILFLLCAVLCYTIGDIIAFQGWQFLTVFILCTPFIFLCKDVNFMPMAYWLIIGDLILSNFYRLFQLY